MLLNFHRGEVLAIVGVGLVIGLETCLLRFVSAARDLLRLEMTSTFFLRAARRWRMLATTTIFIRAEHRQT